VPQPKTDRLPAVVRAANWLGGLGERADWRPADISEDSLLAAARHGTGLSDFGEDGFRENLRALIHAYDAAEEISPVGRIAFRVDTIRALRNRLRLEAAFRRDPAIAEQPVRRPIFVTGLPRTGTTVLFNLLAQDPAGRAPLLWELMYPGLDEPAALRRSAGYMAALRWLVPRWVAIHPMAPREPEECLFLLQNSFVSLDASFRVSVPAFVDRLLAIDMRPWYAHYRRQLQLLQWRRPERHWVLKSPGHLLALDAIVDLFPDAAIVQTHRAPRQVIGSLCSMLAAVRSICCDPVDPRRAGRDALTWWSALLDRALAARATADPSRFADVAYDDLLADPIAVVKRLYDRFGRAYSPELEAGMRRWLRDHPQHRHGVHRYDLADYGLSPEAVDARFADYSRRFGL
jgi:hypothetical protein